MKIRHIIPLVAMALVGVARSDTTAVSLIELKPLTYDVKWGDMLINSCFDGRKVTLAGQDCSEYIFMHAPSSMTFEVPSGATHFCATGVAPQGLKNPGTWIYRIKIDRKVVFESRSLQSYKDLEVPIEIDIPQGAKRIELIVDPMKSEYEDQSIWALPRFETRQSD